MIYTQTTIDTIDLLLISNKFGLEDIWNVGIINPIVLIDLDIVQLRTSGARGGQFYKDRMILYIIFYLLN